MFALYTMNKTPIVFFVYLQVFALFATASTIIRIKRENEIEVEAAEDYVYRQVPQTINVYNLNGDRTLTYDQLLVDCVDTCDDPDVSTSEIRLLSTYASYVHSFGRLPSTVDFGLLKDTETTNVYGMFVLHNDGRVNFFVRHSVFEGLQVDTSYLLLLDIAAHERAHYDNFHKNGEFGHNDQFQREFNSIFWSALQDVSQYKDLYLRNNNTIYEENDDSIIAPVLIVVGIVVVLVAMCISVQLSKPSSDRTARKPLL